MATILRLQPRAKVEDPSLFASHSGSVYIDVMSDETKSFTFWRVFATTPTTSHFNALPIGSELVNIANGVKYIKIGATTWATVTQS